MKFTVLLAFALAGISMASPAEEPKLVKREYSENERNVKASTFPNSAPMDPKLTHLSFLPL
jgi:hypothetical protein